MFIYCVDKNYKKYLLEQGLEFIKEEQIGDKTVFVFKRTDKLNFEELDKTKVWESSTMRFV